MDGTYVCEQEHPHFQTPWMLRHHHAQGVNAQLSVPCCTADSLVKALGQMPDLAGARFNFEVRMRVHRHIRTVMVRRTRRPQSLSVRVSPYITYM